MTNAPISENSTADVQAAAAAVLRMIQGLHISRAVYVAARLGIADLLADGPRSSAQLAQLTRAHAPSLYRVLRLLAALNVLGEQPAGHFALTPLGERLRSGVPGSLRNWAMLTDTVGGLKPFDRIIDSVMTGEAGLKLAYDDTWIDFLVKHPAEAVNFQAAMSERTASFAPSLAATYDFSRMRRVVADRSATESGDFFVAVPSGGDGYLLANVLHDWDDDRSVAILHSCRRAMQGEGRVLIVERMIFSDPERSIPTLLSDLNMMVLTGGQERTEEEYARLLATADLRLTRVLPVAYPYGVIEGAASA
jgi:hypothetical protein